MNGIYRLCSPIVGSGSNVSIDTPFGLDSYMSFGCSGLADFDSSAFLGNSESIISDSAVPNGCLLLVDPVWSTGIVMGVC